MKPRKRLLLKSRLYVIVDKSACGRRAVSDIAGQLKSSGCDIIQLREKESKKEAVLKDAFILRKLLLKTKTLFIVNDYPDIARIADSDGVHLGQEDLPVRIARRVLGKGKIIGVSCHNLKQALRAQKEGADYLGIGPIFPTPAKPGCKATGLGLIKKVKEKISIPFFAVGGINQNNIAALSASGVKRVATCRAILEAGNIASAARNIAKIIQR